MGLGQEVVQKQLGWQGLDCEIKAAMISCCDYNVFRQATYGQDVVLLYKSGNKDQESDVMQCNGGEKSHTKEITQPSAFPYPWVQHLQQQWYNYPPHSTPQAVLQP